MLGLSKQEKEDKKLRKQGIIRTKDKFGNDIYIEDPKLKKEHEESKLELVADVIDIVADIIDVFN